MAEREKEVSHRMLALALDLEERRLNKNAGRGGWGWKCAEAICIRSVHVNMEEQEVKGKKGNVQELE